MLMRIIAYTFLLTMVPARIAFAALVLYASINPGMPSFVPPKYLTTIMMTLVMLFLISWPRIDLPAEPDGSPPPADRSRDASGKSLSAVQKCLAFGCSFLIFCKFSDDSCSLLIGNA